MSDINKPMTSLSSGSPAPSWSPQQNVAVAGKIADKGRPNAKTRDWQMYLFFRVLNRSQEDALLGSLKEFERAETGPRGSMHKGNAPEGYSDEDNAPKETSDDGSTDDETGTSFYEALELEALNPGVSEDLKLDDVEGPRHQVGTKSRGTFGRNLPADGFYDWLNIVAAGDEGVAATINEKLEKLAQLLTRPDAARGKADEKAADDAPMPLFSALLAGFSGFEAAQKVGLVKGNGSEVEEAGNRVVEHGLMATLVHEFRRHTNFAIDSMSGGLVQASSSQLPEQTNASGAVYDRASINVAFTHQGLSALKLDGDTLRSFPEPFRDGMAARAERLGDTGANAPENWYGELGSDRIHGYFTGSFDAAGVREPVWQSLRAEIDRFNTRDPSANATRAALRLLFAHFGMELMHIELGQAPYHVTKGDKAVKPIIPRIEHFGFRDGISQPFVDMKLREEGKIATAPSSGTPARNRTWTPLATGELYLGHPDEDGQYIQQPGNADLRDDGTYLVFRKLEQDVVGFRNFLAQQRPGDPEAQKKLSAQMVGRWPQGASLVLSPEVERVGDDEQSNNFLFAADDPEGKKCPLGAHIRRSNPRDIGGRNNVRRHRLMRRSMGYGGPLLDPASIGDGEERGMLFVAANARIDMQFEVVQADWINSGEFLGQAGLGRCPLTGNNAGRTSDSFLEAGKGAPVTGMPGFVRLRGGDYFFAPSVRALQAMADPRNRFELDPGVIGEGHSFGDVETEELFSKKRIASIIGRIAVGGVKAVGVRPPAAPKGKSTNNSSLSGAPVGADLVFLGKHSDVTKVLSSQPEVDAKGDKKVIYTAARSRSVGKAMLRTDNLLVGTDWSDKPGGEREKLSAIAEAAWKYGGVDWRGRLNAITERSLDKTIARIAPAGSVDLVRDLAADTVYDIVSELFGTPGPDYLTELAISLPFSESRVTRVDQDWLARLGSAASDNVGLDSYNVWSYLVGLNLIGDLKRQREVERLGVQAASEVILHLDRLIDRARGAGPQQVPDNLLASFVSIEHEMTTSLRITHEQYYGHVRSLIFELTLTASSIIPAVFGQLIDAVFEFGLDLGQLMHSVAKPTKLTEGLSQDERVNFAVKYLIYEINRLKPSLPILMRLCEHPPIDALPSGAAVKQGQWVAALVQAANLDKDVFPDPFRLSLYPLRPDHPKRSIDNSLMFGVSPGNVNATQMAGFPPRMCWGKDRIALEVLIACTKRAASLPGLRRIAGSDGELKKLLGITSGLKAKFAPLALY